MSRDKQIEEMRKFVRAIPYLSLDQTNESLVAQYLVNEGYRKADEVAEEIFAEIDIAICEYEMGDIEFAKFYDNIAELKKKYIGKDTNVTTNTEDK